MSLFTDMLLLFFVQLDLPSGNPKCHNVNESNTHTHTRIDKQTFHFFIYFSSFFFLCYTNITLRNCNGNEKQLPNGINE